MNIQRPLYAVVGRISESQISYNPDPVSTSVVWAVRTVLLFALNAPNRSFLHYLRKFRGARPSNDTRDLDEEFSKQDYSVHLSLRHSVARSLARLPSDRQSVHPDDSFAKQRAYVVSILDAALEMPGFESWFES